jgi:CRP-like cAMP-binding protein
MFGEFSAIDGRPRSACVTTLEDTLVARMTSAQFLSLLGSDFRIALDVMRLLTAKSRALTDRLLERSALSMRSRVHAELARLACEGVRNGQSVTIKPAPTHYQLAARVGSHREAITKELSHLETLGYVRVRRKQIVIMDLDKFHDELLSVSPDGEPRARAAGAAGERDSLSGWFPSAAGPSGAATSERHIG